MKPFGTVTLVGAGPGDPDLLTVKACRAIAAADAVVYDRLVSREILDLVPPKAKKVDVGKKTRCHPVPQPEINALLVRLARAGLHVVRLKGGDPFLFGRGSEEMIHLRRAGIRVNVVPGITAAQGCAAAAGVPLTHRGLASGVRLMAGHCRNDGALDLDWDGLADSSTTLVVYMGLANVGEISSRLMAAGRSGDTPVLAVSEGTTPHEKRLSTTLAKVAPDCEANRIGGPVLFIIGEVVRISAPENEGKRDAHVSAASLAAAPA